MPTEPLPNLTAARGDLMMHEPFFWSKGINDFLNSKNYSCYSSKDKDHMPAVPNVDVLTLDDIKAVQGGYTKGRKVMSGRDTITNAMSTDSSYSVCAGGCVRSTSVSLAECARHEPCGTAHLPT